VVLRVLPLSLAAPSPDERVYWQRRITFGPGWRFGRRGGGSHRSRCPVIRRVVRAADSVATARTGFPQQFRNNFDWLFNQ
jgi:hypothetical protein